MLLIRGGPIKNSQDRQLWGDGGEDLVFTKFETSINLLNRIFSVSRLASGQCVNPPIPPAVERSLFKMRRWCRQKNIVVMREFGISAKWISY